jgi:outer membrane receptor protein involved in Fe transport
MYENSQSSNILGISFENANARRYKSEKGDYDIGRNNEKTQNYSIYDNGNYAINDNWNIIYGGRYFFSDYYDGTQRRNINNNNFSFRTGLIYKIKENISVKGLYSQAYRVPSYFEKEVNSATVKGNADLDPEKSDSYDLILVHQLQHFNYTVDLFYTEIKDKISRVDIGRGVKENQNGGDVDYYGVEINTKFKFDDSLWGFAGYSYTKSRNEDIQNLDKFVYDNMFTTALSKRAFSNFTFNGAIKYLDSWGGADSYTLMNLSIDYDVPYLQGLTFEAIANNIFDEDIDQPEIARDSPAVQNIPKDYSTRFYFGMKYVF